MVSRYYPWLEVLLRSFNGITFILLSFLWLHEFRKRGSHWGGYLYLCITAALGLPFCLQPSRLPLVGDGLLRPTVPGVPSDRRQRSASLLAIPFLLQEREGGTARTPDMAGRSLCRLCTGAFVRGVGAWRAYPPIPGLSERPANAAHIPRAHGCRGDGLRSALVGVPPPRYRPALAEPAALAAD